MLLFSAEQVVYSGAFRVAAWQMNIELKLPIKLRKAKGATESYHIVTIENIDYSHFKVKFIF